MSALGQKPTYALQQAMSALHPIATAKANFRKGPCPLYPPKADMFSATAHVCFGPIPDIPTLFDHFIGALEERRRNRQA